MKSKNKKTQKTNKISHFRKTYKKDVAGLGLKLTVDVLLVVVFLSTVFLISKVFLPGFMLRYFGFHLFYAALGGSICLLVLFGLLYNNSLDYGEQNSQDQSSFLYPRMVRVGVILAIIFVCASFLVGNISYVSVISLGAVGFGFWILGEYFMEE